MKKFVQISLILIVVGSVSLVIFAQKKPRKSDEQKPAIVTKTVLEEKSVPAQTPETKSMQKKNERPGGTASAEKKTESKTVSGETISHNNDKDEPIYIYEFSQPNFLLSQIIIKHDANGKGTISFLKKGVDEMISDPISLSPATLEKINNLLKALNFFESNENYQYEKDYSHLGNVKIKVKKDGREREAKFNYTTVQDAKKLADEYRKIGQQYVWIFDINLARENQPLESPRLFDVLDSLIRRNEISDPSQMISFLREISNDERMPLISRNHARKLVKEIEKNAPPIK